jgi:hypothetical protein
VAQVIEYLPSMPKALSLTPVTPQKFDLAKQSVKQIRQILIRNASKTIMYKKLKTSPKLKYICKFYI